MTEEPAQLRSALDHRYRLSHELGRGGMAVVYLAQDLRHDRPVAVKVLRSDLAACLGPERFLREIRIAARLTHPHIAPVYDSGEAAGFLYYVMPYVAGESLRARLDRERQLPLDDAVRLTQEVAEALACAHGAGFIHRDIKPGNILLSGGHAVVADFGLARALEAAAGVEALTVSGLGMGTPLYMSPEQADGGPVDTRTDQYSLGTVLYEMLGGDPPFLGSVPQAILARKRSEPAPRLRPLRDSVTESLERVVLKALARSPADRYATVEEFAAALAAVPIGPAAATEPAALRRQWSTPATTPAPRTGELAVPLPFEVPERGSGVSSGITGVAGLPFVGREAELAQLKGFLDRALAGDGGVAFIAGEAGSGKTALAAEFCLRAATAQPELVVAMGNGNAYTGAGDPYLLFHEVLEQLTGDVEARCLAGSLSRDHARRLWNLLPTSVAALDGVGPDLIDTLVASSELIARVVQYAQQRPEAGAWLPLLEQRRAQRRYALPHTQTLCDQYVQLVRVVAGQAPLVLVLDDLQWADDSSVQLLFQLARGLVGNRVLVLGLFRPSDLALGRGGARHPMEPMIHEIQRVAGDVRISLGQGDDRAFVDALVDAEPNALTPEFREALFGLTGGDALFTVEMLQGLRDDGVLARDASNRWTEARAVDWGRLPPRVEAVIAERVARVPAPLRRALAIASVEGEWFTLEAVAEVGGMPVVELLAGLSGELQRQHQLVRAHGIRRVGGRPVSVYRFRHNLFQRYLYDQLDSIERTLWHEQLGEALETLYGGEAARMPLALARHFEEAGLPARAIPYRFAAGEQAMAAVAREQAMVHFEAALEALLALQPSVDRDHRELELQLALGWARVWAWAQGADEALARARALADRLGTARQRFGALAGLYFLAMWRGDQRECAALMERSLRLGLEEGDSTITVQARCLAGLSAHWRGDFRQAATHGRALLAEYDPDKHRDRRMFYGADFGFMAHTLIGAASWFLGFPDQALRWCREGVAVARELDDPSAIGVELITALLWLAEVHLWRGEALAAAEVNVELTELVASAEVKALYQAYCLLNEAAGRLERGEIELGIEGLRAAMAHREIQGVRSRYRGLPNVLAKALRIAGRPEEGLRLLDRVEAKNPTVDERIDEPEAHRVRGELLLALPQPDPAAAEVAFRQAIAVARELEAKSLELRGATSLARMLQSQGRVEEARQVLRRIYDWFAEGLDTHDLIEARALLDQLDSAHPTGGGETPGLGGV